MLCEAQRSYVITDPRQVDNPIVWVSPSFCELTGYDRDEILGRNCRFLQGPDTEVFRDDVAHKDLVTQRLSSHQPTPSSSRCA